MSTHDQKPDTKGVVGMAELDTKARDKLRGNQFAYVDKAGDEHLPINDAAHVRNAIARFNQTAFESEAAKERARRKIVAAARKFDVEIAPDDKVMKPTRRRR